MRTHSMKSQRGQAMTEFVVAALALFLPLILGVVYVFKYGDIKQQAIQASRYAAMERALDPRAHESDTQVGDETVARFFRDGAQEKIALNERATAATSGDENPNWSQLGGDAMIKQYSDVKVTLSKKSIDSTLLAPVNLAVTNLGPLSAFNGLSGGFGTEAEVNVPLVNVAHFAPLSNINIAIGATTVIAGDPWNGGGAADVASHIGAAVPARIAGKFTGMMSSISNILFEWLADTPAPVFGCVKPDVVPKAAADAQYNPQDDPSNPSNPNDQCY